MKTKKDLRVEALIRFALAFTILNIAGQFFLGFEYSYAHTLVALVTGYTLELLIEFISSKTNNRLPAYSGGVKKTIIFLLPAHISSLAVSMLTFTNVNLKYVVFGVAVAILSKVIVKARINGKLRHVLNPSNTGISALFILFSNVGAAPPYQYTENTSGIYDWLLVVFFISLGFFLNIIYTKRVPLILAWLVGFVVQAFVRSIFTDVHFITALGPMTGVAFLLFTFYMVEDPGTTPSTVRGQMFFGFFVACVYGILIASTIVFGLFFSLTITCVLRLIYIVVIERLRKSKKYTIIPN